LLVGALVASIYYVWGLDVYYTFESVSIANTAEPQDRQLAEIMKQEATAKTFSGQFQYSPLLTLEDLARRGVVTQVAVQWLEPNGWSFTDHNELDVFDKSEIRASEIIDRVSANVHRARIRRTVWFLAPALTACVATLALGIGVAWVRRGFAKQ
jgi:hypothetical protein